MCDSSGLRRFELAIFLFSIIILDQSPPNNQIATTNNAPKQLHQTTTTFAPSPPQPHPANIASPPFSNDARQQPNHHSKPPPPSPFSFHNHQPHHLSTPNVVLSRARSVIVTEHVEPRVQIDAFPGEETDQGSFTPPFPPSNGRASGGVAPPPTAKQMDPFLERETDQKVFTPPFCPTNG